jgi:hypothetical protein
MTSEDIVAGWYKRGLAAVGIYRPLGNSSSPRIGNEKTG